MNLFNLSGEVAVVVGGTGVLGGALAEVGALHLITRCHRHDQAGVHVTRQTRSRELENRDRRSGEAYLYQATAVSYEVVR